MLPGMRLPLVPLLVARVTDQRAEFLRLLEQHALVPGKPVLVESRDELSETVRLRPKNGESLQLGFRAAGRVLVERPPSGTTP